jgi:hypothetical protein
MHLADGVRAAVEAMNREVVLLAERTPTGAGTDLNALRASWGRLTDVLDLGPAPEFRTCRHCGGVGMRAATRCGTCWEALVPPPAPASGQARPVASP